MFVPMEQRFHFLVLEGVGGGWGWRYAFFY